MRNGIREFQPRQQLDRQLGATTLNQILRELESLRITSVVNGTFRKLPGGTEITVAPQRGAGTPQVTHPFQITSFADPEGSPESPTYLVTVQPGTINNILAQNTFSGGIDLTKFSIPADSLRYVCLSVESNDGNIGSTTLSVETQIPPQQEAVENSLPASVKILLGVVYNGTIKQIVTDNLRAYGTSLFTTYQENGRASNWYIWTWQHA
jgi:hypothetical protein